MICGRFVVVWAVVLLSAGVAAAADPYSARVSLNASQLLREAQRPAKIGRMFQPITISLSRIVGVGNATVVLNRRKLPSAQAYFVKDGSIIPDAHVPVLFKGFMIRSRSRNRGLPRTRVAASIIDGAVRLQFLGPSKGSRVRRQRVYSVMWNLREDRAVVARVLSVPMASFEGKACAATMGATDSRSSMPPAAVSAASLETFRVVTLSTDADPNWYAKYGETSNAEIAAIVNAAEAIYERQLGIRFALVRQHVYTDVSPYTSADASILLASFAQNRENPANLAFSPLTFDEDVDVKHLFTGKDLIGNTVGLSYLGAVCWAATSAYGLTQDVNRLFNVTIFAHELGHTFGAQHDLNDPGSIMFPTIGGQDSFSQSSLDQINRFLAFAGKCVSEEVLRPNLSNARLTLKRKRGKKRGRIQLYGRLVSASQKPVAGERIQLTINSRVKMLLTNAEGLFSYTIRLRHVRAKRLVIFARTAGNETSIPGALTISRRA